MKKFHFTHQGENLNPGPGYNEVGNASYFWIASGFEICPPPPSERPFPLNVFDPVKDSGY